MLNTKLTCVTSHAPYVVNGVQLAAGPALADITPKIILYTEVEMKYTSALLV